MRISLAAMILGASGLFAQSVYIDVRDASTGKIILIPVPVVQSSREHYILGVQLEETGQLPAAANELQAALSADLQPPDIAWWAHERLGKIFTQQGDIVRAMYEFEQSSRLKTPNDDSFLSRFPVTYAPAGVIKRTEPEYTEQARRAGLEGTVELRCSIGPDRQLQKIDVMRRLGLGLDEKAVDAVRKWDFRPAAFDDQTMTETIVVGVSFSLPEKKSRWHLRSMEYENEDGVTPPEIESARYPLGPGISRAALDEGRILGAIGRLASAKLWFEIDERGRPREFQIIRASEDMWGREAIALISQWRFHAGRKNGSPVRVPCMLELVWGPRNLPAQLVQGR